MWELAELPPGKNLVTRKWVFKVKHDVNGNSMRIWLQGDSLRVMESITLKHMRQLQIDGVSRYLCARSNRTVGDPGDGGYQILVLPPLSCRPYSWVYFQHRLSWQTPFAQWLKVLQMDREEAKSTPSEFLMLWQAILFGVGNSTLLWICKLALAGETLDADSKQYVLNEQIQLNLKATKVLT